MNDEKWIVSDRDHLGGNPRVQGTRISIAFLLECLAGGMGVAEIVDAYPTLSKDAVQGALRELAHERKRQWRKDPWRLTMMEKLTVDAEGRIIIPSEVIQKRGLRPGDELTLVESAEGLLVYQGGVDAKTSAWWNRLDDRQRVLAEDDARRYESLSEQKRDSIWNQEADSYRSRE